MIAFCITGSLSAVIDGLPWAACAPVSFLHNSEAGVLTIAGGDVTPSLAVHIGFSLGFPVPGPGTFPYTVTLGPDTPASATLTVANAVGDPSLWSADDLNGETGMITVASFAGNRATGRFSFTLVPLASSGATGNKTVTEGAFDVTF